MGQNGNRDSSEIDFILPEYKLDRSGQWAPTEGFPHHALEEIKIRLIQKEKPSNVTYLRLTRFLEVE